MYGKLDNNGNITFYNGYSVTLGDLTVTNPSDEDLRAAGYKPVLTSGYIINVTDAKLTVEYTDMGSHILMVHKTEDGYMGELPEEEEEE